MIAPKRNRAPKIFSWGRACAGYRSISTPKAEELAGFPSVPLQAGSGMPEAEEQPLSKSGRHESGLERRDKICLKSAANPGA